MWTEAPLNLKQYLASSVLIIIIIISAALSLQSYALHCQGMPVFNLLEWINT